MPLSLPAPRDALNGCVWLPRYLVKARLLLINELPPDYAERLGHPAGVDGQFLRFFGVTHEQLIEGVREHPTDAEFSEWFRSLPGIDEARIEAWNDFAEKLGQPGQPMAERFNEKLPGMAGRFDTSKVHSIFDLITADEANP